MNEAMKDLPGQNNWYKYGPARLLLELKEEGDLESYKASGDPDDVAAIK
jgi:hypothetical protein